MLIEVSNLSFSYPSSPPVLDGVSFCVSAGELFSVVGGNGSGKSTLARCLNALLPPPPGSVKIDGMDASDPENLYSVRRECGMVFQDPENEFVSSVAGEDISFGLRNFDFPEAQIPAIISKSLARVGLEGFENRNPASLSGGQKQRLAIAAVIALNPKAVILDEATSMLDPEGRRQVTGLALDLKERGVAVIMITHFLEEAALSDRVMALSRGKVAAIGAPEEVLAQEGILKEAGLRPLLPTEAYRRLEKEGLVTPSFPPIGAEGLWRAMCR